MAFVKQYNEDEEESTGASGGQGVIQGQAAGSVGAAPGMAQGPGKDFTKSQFVSAKKIMDKNRGSAQADLTQPYRQQIGQAQQQLGGALDQYKQQTTAAQEQAKKLAGGVQGAVQGDQEAFSGLKNLLGGGVQVGQFEAPKAGVDFEGAQSLGTQAGAAAALKKQASRQGVTNYGAARSSLDASLFAQDPMARQRNKELQEQRMALGAQTSEAQKTAQEQAAAAQAEIAKQQEAARSGLTAEQQKITSAAKERAQQASNLQQAQLTDALANNPEFRAFLLDTAKKYGTDKKMIDVGGGKMMDQSEFVDSVMRDLIKKQGASYSANPKIDGPLYDENQAAKFNSIVDLLGGDPTKTVQAQQAPTAKVDLNRAQLDFDKEASKAATKYSTTRKEYEKATDAASNLEALAAQGQLMTPDMIKSYGIRENIGLGLDSSKVSQKFDQAFEKGISKYIKNQLTAAKEQARSVGKPGGASGPQMNAEVQKIYQQSGGGSKGEKAVKEHLMSKQMSQLNQQLSSGLMDQKEYKKIQSMIKKAYA